jgi:hypothetical protein
MDQSFGGLAMDKDLDSHVGIKYLISLFQSKALKEIKSGKQVTIGWALRVG